MPDDDTTHLSPVGMNYLGGLLQHATPATVFSTPTINGFRRFQANSLAPDRATWSHDHRGVMVRVLGGADDPATRYENRVGEPAANPYLYIASQIIAGLDGIDSKAEPWPADDEPYESDRPMLPTSLGNALTELEDSPLYGDALGPLYRDYFIALKKVELARYTQYLEENPARDDINGVTGWEQNEYFDFF
jgi:glutamine synthetase